jgi:hypothetical protein
MSHFFTLENAISPASSHSCNIQKFCAIDHMIVCCSKSVRLWRKLKHCDLPSRLATQTPLAST